jgi:hypothetical protein
MLVFQFEPNAIYRKYNEQAHNYVLRIPLASLEILWIWLPLMENEHNSVNYMPWEGSLAHQLRVLLYFCWLYFLLFPLFILSMWFTVGRVAQSV